MNSISQINIDTPDGRLLMASIAIITTECRRDKTPDGVIKELNELSKKMFMSDRGDEMNKKIHS